MERVFENYLNDIYVDVLNCIEKANLPVKYIRFFQKQPSLLMCELYTMSGEVNKFKRIAIVYSLKAMYYAINVDKALVSQENLPITVNKIDSKNDYYESTVAMTLLCAVIDKLTGPANEALEYMLEIAKHSYESEYRSIKDISSVNIKRIAEIEDIDITKFETSVTSNTVAIEFTKEGEKANVKLIKRMEDYTECELSDNLKIRILISLLLVKYFFVNGDADKFDCVYYQQSNTMNYPKSLYI